MNLYAKSISVYQARSLRLLDYDYSSPGSYFITIAVKNRECLFGEIEKGKMELNVLGELAAEYFNRISEKYCSAKTDTCTIMPDHVHAIITIAPGVGVIHESRLQVANDNMMNRRKMLLSKIIGWYKMNTAKEINHARGTTGSSVWQRGFHERIIRNAAERNKIASYIQNNALIWQKRTRL